MEASIALQHRGTTAQVRGSECHVRDIATQTLRRECEQGAAKVVHDRAIVSTAFETTDLEHQQRSEMSNRLRSRSIEMQRSIGELVDMRDLARGETIRFRPADVQAVNAAREAQERPDTVVRQLRQQLLTARTELAAAATPQSVREHG